LFLSKTDIGDRVELQFIDVFEDGRDGHVKVKMFMDRGLSLPLISIADQKFLYGGISNQLIYNTSIELCNSR
jgi:hypothetical protein